MSEPKVLSVASPTEIYVIHDNAGYVTGTYPVPRSFSLDVEMAVEDFVALASARDAVQTISAQHVGEGLELWLFANPIEHDEELNLYRLRGQIYEQYPDIPVRIHIVHPGRYETDAEQGLISLEELEAEVPTDADRVYAR